MAGDKALAELAQQFEVYPSPITISPRLLLTFSVDVLSAVAFTGVLCG